MHELVPVTGATAGGKLPQLAMTADAGTLTATDRASGATAVVRPAALYVYRYEPAGSEEQLQGVAALDADGLVLLDLPGGWPVPELKHLAERAGIPVSESRYQSPGRITANLAARAPGWRRLSGRHRGPRFTRGRKIALVGAGVAGLAVMTILALNGMWFAWRGVSTLGRILIELLEAKWLFLAFFSPLLLVMRPITGRLHRWRVGQGSIVGPPSGPYLVGRQPSVLEVVQGGQTRATLRRGRAPGLAAGLLLYRHEDLTGLFVLDSLGKALHHLPGPWPAADLDRFAKRNDLTLAVHGLSHEEYATLARSTRSATP
ncbi:hypothetical protein Nocox_02465 [Nonomuraea coxensis DSM 45129]|uniref:Uncharacterized protein n=1 Tax=Nonomuraea coxensis DSM 45129 TaxID=1122611 RepID=A0ABX8TSB8_9ACTN|nr:hypothetical protein [Nonomuraea coxensis]QYC38126.1 hypothetical protein Nocox_02465 [Nonomuraea coxensis DSM 45129]